MKPLKVPFVSANQRALPGDFNGLAAACLNGVANIVGHLLVDPANNDDGLVAWGLQVSAVGAGEPMTVKAAKGAGVLKSPRNAVDGSIPPTDEGLALVESTEVLYVTLESGVANRTFIVYLVGALDTGDVAERDFRSVAAGGDVVQAVATPTTRWIKPRLEAYHNGTVPQHSIKLATVAVDANVVEIVGGDITDSRRAMFSTSTPASPANLVRGARTHLAWLTSTLNTASAALNTLTSRVNAAINEAGSRFRHLHLDNTNAAATPATDGLKITTASISRARVIVQPAYIDDPDNAGDLKYGSATYIGHNIKSVTRVSMGVYDVVLADALVAAIGGDNPITFASKWAIVGDVAPFYEEDNARIFSSTFPGPPYATGAVRVRAYAVTTAKIRVALYLSRLAAGEYEVADLPFVLDVQGPFTGDPSSVVD